RIEGYRAFIAVDIESMLGDAWNGQCAELASCRQDQSVIVLGRGCTANAFNAHKVRLGVDGSRNRLDEGDASRSQRRRQRCAQRFGIALIQPRPNGQVRTWRD